MHLNLSKQLLALLYVVRTDYDISILAARKGIHIFDENVLLGKLVEYRRQLTSHVGATDANHISEHYSEVIIAKHLNSLVHIADDETQDTELSSLCHTEGMHIDAIGSQYLCHVVDSSRLVLKKNRNLFDCHIIEELRS